jgi:hypothetical protein
MKKIILNELQIAHQTHKKDCSKKMCELPGCTNCLDGLKSNAKYCCPQHKNTANNAKNKIKFEQVLKIVSLNRKNSTVVYKLYSIDPNRIYTRRLLASSGYDPSVQPILGDLKEGVADMCGKIAVVKIGNDQFKLIQVKNG